MTERSASFHSHACATPTDQDRFSGIFLPIPTPFRRDEELDLPALEENLSRWCATGIRGFAVMGSTGEFPALSREEKGTLLAAVAGKVAGKKILLAGTGCESLRETLLLSREAAALGYDALLVLPPHYYKNSMTDAALERYFLDVADMAPLPLFLYNMPANTGINLSPALTVRLAAHPNVAGIKDSTFSASQLAAIAAEMPKDFRLFAGRGSMLLATLLLGGRGGTLTVANVAPEFCVALYEAWCAGDLERARRMQFSLLPLNEAVTVRFGPAGIKAALDLAGYRGGPCRKPLLPLASDQKEELKRILERFTEDVRDLR